MHTLRDIDTSQLDNEARYILALSALDGTGPQTIRQLISFFGSAEAIFANGASVANDLSVDLSQTLRNILGSIPAKREAAFAFADRQLEYVQRYNIQYLTYSSPSYPARLSTCPDAPVALFAMGKINFGTAKILSVVGTRQPSAEGRDITESIVGELCNQHPDLLIVSGLAYGIDITAHRVALRAKRPTVACVAHGLDRVYPYEHRADAQQMVSNGGLVTEFPFGTKPEAYNFVSRNRIIAGLADATLIVESGVKGGSLITVNKASEYGRQVLAVPGFPNRENSRGCNALIKNNVAHLVENAQDIEAALSWDVPAAVRKVGGIQASLFAEPQTDEERAIVETLRAEDGLTASVIATRSHLAISTVNVTLLQMEFNGLVKSLPGNSYRLMI